jgi:uncharacterized protein (TIGR03790 family)
MTTRAILCALIVTGCLADARAQSPANVVVIVNDASDASKRIGEHYARSRNLPPGNVIHISTATTDGVSRPQYVAQIELPIAVALRRDNLHDRVLYLVLTKGVPLRIDGTGGQEATMTSVDSELTLLYRKMTGRTVTMRGRIPNPYYLGSKPLAAARPFTHREHDIYLVTRLTGFTVDDALALIDRGREPRNDGRFVLDQRGGLYSTPLGDRELAEASRRLGEQGLGERVILETTTNPARNVDNVLGYYGWGSNDPENRVRRTEMRFAAGALAALFVSGDARTFDEPPKDWRPTGDLKNRKVWYLGSPHSLTGDLIREGVTGAGGYVGEPYLQSAIRPEILFPAYASGFNLAEAFYLALPDLGWQSVIVGDPLCAPFPRPAIDAADIDPGIDGETELPRWYAARRLEFVRTQHKALDVAALALFVRAETRLQRGDSAGAREAFTTLVKQSPDYAAARLQLGMLLDGDAEYAAAREQYAALLKTQPNNVIALNNLAYSLAVHEKNPAEGLALARRAFALVPRDIRIIDTLSWIYHLQGNSAEAAKLLRDVVQRNTGNTDVHFHAAIVFAAVGDLRAAEQQLSIAVRLDKTLEEHSDVKALRQRLANKS